MSEQLLNGHTLTSQQQEAAANMAVATDTIVASYYGAACSKVERVTLADTELTPQQSSSIDELSDVGQAYMASRYGIAYPVSQPGSDAHLGYNNGDHVRSFIGHAKRLDSELGITSTAALINERVVPPWHDTDQTNIVKNLPRLGEDEQRSTELLVAEMRRQRLPKHIAEVAAHGILGTWVVVDKNGAVVGQWGGLEHDYPSKDAEMAAKCAATNDLAGIYSPRGPLDACFLYAQRHGTTPNEVPPLGDFPKHLASQKIFLEKHRFPLEAANQVFTSLKGEVIRHTDLLIAQVEAGSFDDPEAFWNDMIQQNIRFMERHS